jgi:translation elongation factor EF-Tu-like GTPase
MMKKVDFIALLNYKTPEEGGRILPASSGYRPAIKFPFSEMQTSGSQTFIDREKVFPGETVKAEIKIVSAEYFKGKLYENLDFDFREGAAIIGTGLILEITNQELSKASS